MPELPEVETVRAGLEQAWVGRTITEVTLRRAGLRFPFPEDMVQRLTGQTVAQVRRRAKYLLIDTTDGLVFLSHLGMSGRYTLISGSETARFHHVDASSNHSKFGELTGFDGRHDHMEFQFDDGSVAVYTDPRRFGIADLLNGQKNRFNHFLNILALNLSNSGLLKMQPYAAKENAHLSRPLYSTNALLSVLEISMRAKHCTVPAFPQLA